jgi:hypothetical protein
VRKGAKSRLRPPGQTAPANDPARLINQSNAAVSERRFASYQRGKLFPRRPRGGVPGCGEGYDDAGSSGSKRQQETSEKLRYAHGGRSVPAD